MPVAVPVQAMAWHLGLLLLLASAKQSFLISLQLHPAKSSDKLTVAFELQSTAFASGDPPVKRQEFRSDRGQADGGRYKRKSA